MKTTLTSFLAGALLMVGSAMAAQTSTSPKPAAKTSTASKTTSKKVAHNKKKHSKATKSVAKKNAAPVTPVAAKK